MASSTPRFLPTLVSKSHLRALLAFVPAALAFGACRGESIDGDPTPSGGATSGNGGGGGDGGEGASCPDGTGGLTYFWNCPAELEASCGAAGEGGGGGFGGTGDVPALARLCQERDMLWPHALTTCLMPLAEDPCAEDHDANVRACLLETEAPCFDESVCDEVVEECPELGVDACYYGFFSKDATNDAESCFFSTETADESCVERFLRCAWNQ